MLFLSKNEIVALVNEIVDCSDKTKEVMDDLIERLENGVLDPQIMNYIFWSEMTPEEIVNKALAYKSVCL